MKNVFDVCGEPVDFDPMTRTFSHRARTWCHGIDGVVLSAPHWDRVECRRVAPAPLHPIMRIWPNGHEAQHASGTITGPR